MTGGSSMGEVRSGASTARLRPPPPFAAPPARVHQYTSLIRLHGYLRPYLSRWVTMFVVALLGTGATIVVPLVTKAVIDGPIADRDERGLFTLGAFAVALGVVEARPDVRPALGRSRATLGVETAIRMDLYAQLQRLPMAFHGRWQSGQLLSRMMSDLSTVRRFLGFGLLFIIVNILQIGVVTAILLQHVLAARPGGARPPRCRSCCWSMRNERVYTRLSRAGPGRDGDVASAVEEGATACASSRRSAGPTTCSRGSTSARCACTRPRWRGPRLGAVLDLPRGHPERHPDLVLGFGALAAGQGRLTLGTLVAFITLMLSLVWPVASLGFLLSMTQESMTAADRIAEILDAETRHPGRRPRAGPAARRAAVRGRGVPLPRRRARRPARPRPRRRRGRDRGRGGRHRLRQDGPDRPAAAPVRRHGRRDHDRRPRHPRR